MFSFIIHKKGRTVYIVRTIELQRPFVRALSTQSFRGYTLASKDVDVIPNNRKQISKLKYSQKLGILDCLLSEPKYKTKIVLKKKYQNNDIVMMIFNNTKIKLTNFSLRDLTSEEISLLKPYKEYFIKI